MPWAKDVLASTSSTTAESTFRNFTPSDGAAYATGRFDYHPTLYNLVHTHHLSTGGQSTQLLDVGCGPGNAARALSPHFQHARGIDPSAGMIAAAEHLGGKSRGGDIEWVVDAAEDLTGVENGSVDLLVCATAAHWFDLSRFWVRAGEVVRPGGTVAVWTHRGLQIHPETPRAREIVAALEEVRREQIVPYERKGGNVAAGLYVDLPLPWTGETSSAFDPDSLRRVEFGTQGLTDLPDTPVRTKCEVLPGDQFFADGEPEISLETYEANLGTTSTIKRWREAEENRGKVGTEDDVVRVMRRRIEGILRGAGQRTGEERVKRADPGVVLLFKRRAE